MSYRNSDLPKPEEEKPRKVKLDTLAWVFMIVAIVQGVVVLPLMIMGVISAPLALGISFPIVGGLQILNSTLRLKKPRLREINKRYTASNLRTLRGIGIMQVVLGVISLTVALAFGMIRGERLW